MGNRVWLNRATWKLVNQRHLLQSGSVKRGQGIQQALKKKQGKKKERGFKVVKRRWVVERTFAWLGRNRRLSKEYEGTVASSEAFIKLAMVHLMARRIVRKLDL